MATKFIVSPSPHIHSGDSVEKNMYGVLIALLPALLASFYFFGLGAIVITLTSVLGCMAVEYLIVKFLLKSDELTILDGSAALTGVLLALNLPSNLPFWIVLIGAVAAIGIGKMSFGGLGNNVFNPAILGRVLLLISFPAQMTSWPTPGQLAHYTDVETGATPLGVLKGIVKNAPGASMDQLSSMGEMFFGQIGGSLGEVSAIALLIGFAFLLIRRIITWHIPIAIFAAVILFGGTMHLINPEIYANPLVHLLSGGMLLGAIFMATDYVTSPMSKSGMLLYGFLIGLITMLIRLFGAYPEGMSFAILIMNAFTPLINLYMKPKLFGDKK
ncbi:RnfABCDGE type electron transport complex subunit D [Porphyromonas sp.]|uniref:RnfABCDGE type electron transport complex subunit D n=1 Tax=Porphyromonas sp. TaxID=1924944 RepID=UPI0026DC9F10|nr:RnfABCDGE type electron transport complex subunit D [Porphyromonas sp.]MDO4695381.1 RnfABCDGE type electron transport complex subunit D [Porphyromonas sp.]MDO4770492.1 RnfABCDGE type electron transport complex subunit D [Porphyromonas sp.]